MQYRHTRTEITNRYIIIHFAAHIQAHRFVPRTPMTSFRLTWTDLYLLFQKPGRHN